MKTTKRLIALAALALAAPAQGAELPRGFAGLAVGGAWEGGADAAGFRSLAALVSDRDRHARECGYRVLRRDAPEGTLLVTVHDFVITGLSLARPLAPGTDLLGEADRVMQAYGQPASASIRDLRGNVTLDRTRANFVTLEYAEPRPVRFTLSGRDVWRHQVDVGFEHARWHENRTWRCAREKGGADRATAAR